MLYKVTLWDKSNIKLVTFYDNIDFKMDTLILSNKIGVNTHHYLFRSALNIMLGKNFGVSKIKYNKNFNSIDITISIDNVLSIEIDKKEN